MAEAAILEKGFAATSIEELIAAVGITECGVFSAVKLKLVFTGQLFRFGNAGRRQVLLPTDGICRYSAPTSSSLPSFGTTLTGSSTKWRPPFGESGLDDRAARTMLITHAERSINAPGPMNGLGTSRLASLHRAALLGRTK